MRNSDLRLDIFANASTGSEVKPVVPFRSSLVRFASLEKTLVGIDPGDAPKIALLERISVSKDVRLSNTPTGNLTRPGLSQR